MTAIANKIADEALTLPADLRAALVDRLIESLNVPSQKQLDALWAKEAEKRLKAVKQGKVKTIPGGLVFSEIRAKYGR
ncbi:MAG: addiction module protein [Chitinispirillaceae bacterium]|nr:addiction module protein [Chitinispirillaceae bacterium]